MPRNASTPLPQPVFSEGNIVPDPTRFRTPHPSDTKHFAEIRKQLTKDAVKFGASRGQPHDVFELTSAFGPHGPEIVQRIRRAGKIIFHSGGDTGASNSGKYGNELRVSDQLTKDLLTADVTNRPAFLYHLGDVVYNFGESQYYYDQFYEPLRDYSAPVLAIPGNHDSFICPGTPAKEAPLAIFERNFCARRPAVTAEAGSLHRTAMTQPGIYFSLDAPFVRIIGLFSNALENPGLISSEGGRWTGVPDVQLAFLEAQLERVKEERYDGALLLAVHHPPFTFAPPAKAPGAGGHHTGSPDMLREIDAICAAAGVYPHAVLSGHAHNYQRFTRSVPLGGKAHEVPFIVCGDSGHNVTKIVRGKRGHAAREPHFGEDVSYLDAKKGIKATGLRLNHYDDTYYGYLRITVDKDRLTIGYHHVGQSSVEQSRVDSVSVNLASHTLVAT